MNIRRNSRILEKSGFKVLSFEDGESLLEQLSSGDSLPDLILLDIGLPIVTL